MERMHLQPERLDSAKPIRTISFLEVTHKENRWLLQQYLRYELGLTELTVNTLNKEAYYIKNFWWELGKMQRAAIYYHIGINRPVFQRIIRNKNRGRIS